MTFLKDNWFKIFIALIVIFLLWVVFRECNPAPDHSAEKKTQDSLFHVIDQMKKDSLKKVEEDSIKIKIAADKFDSAQLELSESQGISKRLSQSAQVWKQKYLKAKAEGDIDSAIADCDRFIPIIDSQNVEIDTQRALNNSLMIAHTAEVEGLQNQQATTMHLYLSTDSALTSSHNAYNGLSKDYVKQVKANKFNKTLSRVLGIAVIILGGSLYLTNK